ncbi:MAG: 7-carboxy-7-deazaguanine synthase QueE [Deltaproteobacteria bacterium]|nr:7-carboxy-7-deazaguanine synthase QueE [Deltaproteobacteria bacterium]
MRISEIFYSIQGEGRLLGVPSVFIRTSGCNLRCVWCDTPYTSWRPEGRERSVAEILREVQKYPARHVVITGGEPLLAPEIEELTKGLKREGAHITIETAATIFKPVACDLMSLSPKLANSTPWKRAMGKFASMHEERRLNWDVIGKYLAAYDYQLKFVVERRRDFNEIGDLLGKLSPVDPTRVLVMALELCKEHGYGFTPRMHIDLFGNRRGT